MKRLLSLFVVSCLLLMAVFGFSMSASGDSSVKTLRFLTVGDPFVGAVKALLPEFKEKYGIDVVVDSVPYLDLHAKAMLELAGGTGSYDLVSVDMPWIGEFDQGGYLYDLSGLVERDSAELNVPDFLPGAWQGLAVWNDKIIGMPLAPYYMYMHYRTDVFEKLGLSVPEDMASFEDCIQKMYDPENSFYGWAVAMKRGPSIVHDWCAFFNGFGGKTFVDAPNNYASGFNSEIGVKTTEMFKDMLQHLPDGVQQYENADRWNAFMHGQAGMVAVFNANSPMFESAEDTKVAGNVGYFGMPKLDSSAKSSLPFAGFTLSINKDSKNIEDAWTFTKWLTSAETDKKWVDIPGTPGIPLRVSTVTDPALLEKYPYFKIISDAESSGTADGVNYRSRLPQWTQIEDIMGLELSYAMTGDKDIQTALDDAAKQINELMKKDGYPVQ